MTVYTMDDLEKAKKRAKRREWKETLKRKVDDAKFWVMNNSGMIMLIAPPVLGVVTALVRTTGRQVALKKEQNLKELYCYDRSLGHYWKLKRPLKNSDWIHINARRDNGENLGNILNDMKVLK